MRLILPATERKKWLDGGVICKVRKIDFRWLNLGSSNWSELSL